MVIRIKRMRAAALLLGLLLAVACLSSCVNGQGEGSGTARAEGNLYGSEAEPLSSADPPEASGGEEEPADRPESATGQEPTETPEPDVPDPDAPAPSDNTPIELPVVP